MQQRQVSSPIEAKDISTNEQGSLPGSPIHQSDKEQICCEIELKHSNAFTDESIEDL
eukprot:CAMPEP_0202956880 /NCGR_PEP_ID=MMETSP1396-20130829/1355_1 /ASSEMBLY_ACC=CAM_ASM_000872 /TAXON_ID= /ORGANISM="Pseudokeronopsis sp., Strain Brazil" /LENGTH=56 /DNA_ID=CAMNT_0049674095 /DNA_START=189 /DNA_END=359 /DNA_ORIENTATION=+